MLSPFLSLVSHHNAAVRCQAAVNGAGPCAPGRACEYQSPPREAEAVPDLQLEVKRGASPILRSLGDTRYPRLSGSEGLPRVKPTLPWGGSDAGKATPLRCGRPRLSRLVLGVG